MTVAVVQGEFPDERFLSFQRGKVFRVLLDGGKQQAIVRNDGSFSIYDVRVIVIFNENLDGKALTPVHKQPLACTRPHTHPLASSPACDFTSIRISLFHSCHPMLKEHEFVLCLVHLKEAYTNISKFLCTTARARARVHTSIHPSFSRSRSRSPSLPSKSQTLTQHLLRLLARSLARSLSCLPPLPPSTHSLRRTHAC
jgi:hypothetical protein